MATGEEYLDNLLKSITEKEAQPQVTQEITLPEEEMIPEEVVLPEEDMIPEEVVLPEEDMISKKAILPEEEMSPEELMLSEEDLISIKAALLEEELLPEETALPKEDMISEESVLPKEDLFSADSMLSQEELSFDDDMLSETGLLSKEDIEFESEIPSVKDESSADDEEWMEDLKNLMGNDVIPEDDSDLTASINDMDDMDIADLLDGMGSIDDELEEISGLLKHADDDESVDVDMLALLEGIDGSGDNEESADLFAALLDNSDSDETEKEESVSEQTEEEASSAKTKKKRAKKDKSKKKRWFFGKKKRNGEADGDGEIPTELVVPFEVAETVIEKEKGETGGELPEDTDMQENIGEEPEEGSVQEGENGMEQEETAPEAEAEDKEDAEQKPEEKKQGFFARLFHALTREEDDLENISEENKDILNELEEEDKKNSKKKEKNGKKGGKKKKGKEAEDEDEEAAENAEADGKKKKKPKKEKKPKEERPKEKTVKVLSKRKLIVLIAFCATILGSIILLSVFLPEYADKKSARNAYNVGNYEEVYTLLYGRNLNSGDLLIFNRAKTIRKMERRIESYNNNLAMGRELEALDSLLKGVECYQTLVEADEYGVRQEVDALYQQICTVLNENYGITAEDAIEINSYDSETYTKRLYASVYGTSFTGVDDGSAEGEAVPEEPAEWSQPQDVLADEEDIISY